MQPSAVAITVAILWGGLTFLAGLINLAAPSYGSEYLRMMSSFHPGLYLPGSFGDVLAGGIAGVVDGAVAGFLFSWIYNWLVDLFAAEPKLKGAPLRRGI